MLDSESDERKRAIISKVQVFNIPEINGHKLWYAADTLHDIFVFRNSIEIIECIAIFHGIQIQ